LVTTNIGRYRILDKVGQGGMGVVYRAYDTLLEREVALKIIATSIEDNPELRERFFREARAAGQLSHRNIITIHDLGEHEGQPYLAMEFLNGEDLQHRLARQEPMALRRKLEIASEICEGLAYAHRRGLIHRDVKPANIFITDEGVVKLLDFGLARMVASELTRSNMMMGTLNYMAPEQVRGERTDHRADIFSFGVVLYEMLSGRKAFQGDSFATTLYKILQDVPEPLLTIDPTLPHEIAWLVEKTLAKPKDERYQDLGEVSRDLTSIRQHLSGPDADTMAASAPGGARVPSDSPRPATRPRSGSASRAASGAAETTFASAPPVLDQPASGTSRARRRAPVLLLAVAALGLAAGWYVLRPDPSADEAGPATAPAATQTPPAVSAPAPQPSAGPEPLPAPPAAASPVDGALTALGRSADEARVRMARSKAAARRAGTAATRSPAYAAGAAAEQEGNQLYRAKRLADAAVKFYEASGLFQTAELLKASPAAEPQQPQRVESAPPASTPAPVQAPTPTVPAGEVAVDLPPSAAPRLPPPPAPAPAPAPSRPTPAAPTAAEGTASPASVQDAIRDLLKRYEQALEARSLDALKRIWPGLEGAQEDAVRREFQHARRIAVDLDDPAITVSGNSGTVNFVRRYNLTTVDGQRLDSSSRTTMAVRRSGSDWVIESVRFQPIR
jgi:serine/threonine-protein kinase